MAAAAFARAAVDELSCPICLELFVGQFVPKDLPGCDHVVCNVCLKNLTKDLKGETRVINCPECRKESKLPKDGVNSLKTNRKVRNLAEKHPRDSVAAREADLLDENDAARDATEEQTSREKVAKPKVPMCSEHEQERMHYYCIPCNTSACLACLILKHTGPNHKIEGIKDRYAVRHRELEKRLTEAKSKIASCTNGLDHINDFKKSTQQAQNTEEHKLETMLDMVRKTGREDQQRIDHQIGEFEQHIQSIQSVFDAVSSTHANATQYEYLAQHSSLCDQLEKITIKHPENVTITRVGVTLKTETIGQEVSFHLVKKPDDPERAVDGGEQDRDKQPTNPTKLTRIQILATPKGTVNIKKYGPALDNIDWSPSGLLALLHRDNHQIAIYRKYNRQYKMYLIWKVNPRCLGINPETEWSDEVPIVGGMCMCSRNNVYLTALDHIQIYTIRGQLIQRANIGRLDGIRSVKIRPSGAMLVGISGGFNNRYIMEIDPSNVGVCKVLDVRVRPNSTTLLHGGRYIAMCGDYSSVSVMDTYGPGHVCQEKLHIENMENVTTICYHEQSNSLFAVTKDGSCIEQYCCTSGRKLAVLLDDIESGIVWDLAVSKEGILALLCDKDLIELYQVETKAECSGKAKN